MSDKIGRKVGSGNDDVVVVVVVVVARILRLHPVPRFGITCKNKAWEDEKL